MAVHKEPKRCSLPSAVAMPTFSGSWMLPIVAAWYVCCCVLSDCPAQESWNAYTATSSDEHLLS